METDHERARRLLDMDQVEGISAADREWLDQHLDACAGCSAHRERTAQALQLLRSQPIGMNPALVNAALKAKLGD